MDPRTADSVGIFEGESMDPRTADLVGILKGDEGIHGPSIWSKFIKGKAWLFLIVPTPKVPRNFSFLWYQRKMSQFNQQESMKPKEFG